MEMKMYHVAETINKDFTGKYELKEKIGDIISSNIEATNIINKGKMYANIINGNQYETQYEVKWETNIISPEMANQIILEGTEEQFVKGNEEIATNSYFIETIIDAENAKSILGKTGRIEILNGDNIVETILLENSTEEEIKITYTEKYETLTFRTSEIIKEGNLKIAHKKGIQEITQTKESLKEIKEMATEVKTRMKVTGSEVVLETLSERCGCDTDGRNCEGRKLRGGVQRGSGRMFRSAHGRLVHRGHERCLWKGRSREERRNSGRDRSSYGNIACHGRGRQPPCFHRGDHSGRSDQHTQL